MIQNTCYEKTEFLIPNGFPILQRSKGLNTRSGSFLWTDAEHQQAIKTMELNGYSIQLNNKNVTKASKKNGCDGFNKYRSEAKKHNSDIILSAVNNYKGNKSISGLINSDDFYKAIKPKLRSVLPDSEKKPTRKTLINYMSEIKSTNKNK